MPLPEALAARLAKRGIIKHPSVIKEPEPEVTNTTQEEVIAEDYDDTPQPGDTPIPPPPEKFDKFQGWYSCPNKWNVYHECTPACQEQWKEVKETDKDYNRKRIKMLLKYPLPIHWQEVLDAGICRYYYWNMETDLVSWLPPGHPKCRVSLSASFLRKQMIEEREERLIEESIDGKRLSEAESSDEEEVTVAVAEKSEKRKRSVDEEAMSGASSDESGDEEKPPKEKMPKIKKERESEREKERERDRGRAKERGRGKERERRGKRKEADSLDPMDPAAYSECPRGTWASGLPERNEARTGVDTTATGPLFQMRPYPNPGAVLRANSGINNTVGPKKPS